MELSIKNPCPDCNLWERRVKELEIKNDNWQDENENLRDAYDLKCDAFKELLVLNARFRILLHDARIDHEL